MDLIKTILHNNELFLLIVFIITLSFIANVRQIARVLDRKESKESVVIQALASLPSILLFLGIWFSLYAYAKGWIK